MNPARDLAATGTPGPWTAEPVGSEGFHVFGPEGSRAPMRGRARAASCVWQDWDEASEDAEKIARAVNALPALADLLDLLADHRPVSILGRDQCWKCVGNVPYPCDRAAARDAVAAALTGETP